MNFIKKLQSARASLTAHDFALVATLLLTPILIALRHFTVDDALISARVAANLANGHGYSFNPDGPRSDAVTPLGWVFLLLPFAKAGPLAAFHAAKFLGAALWLATAYALFLALARSSAGGNWWRWLACSPLAVSLPLASYAVSGMETIWVTAALTLAVLYPRQLWLAGVASALRPELMPWALVWAIFSTAPFAPGAALRRALFIVALACMPFFVRWLTFGHALPLAFVAKPSDLSHGLRYAWGGLVFSGFPILCFAPRVLLRLGPRERAIGAAAIAHGLSVVLAGGDWMPNYRLFVPILPSLAWLAAAIFERSSLRAALLRWVCGLLPMLVLLVGRGHASARVGEERAALMENARPWLAPATKKIAALDIGWLGAITAAPIIDLAGVTDKNVAFLPGGHTTKRIPARLLADAETLVLLTHTLNHVAPGSRPSFQFARGVENRVFELVGEQFELQVRLPLGDSGDGYLIFRRKADAR